MENRIFEIIMRNFGKLFLKNEKKLIFVKDNFLINDKASFGIFECPKDSSHNFSQVFISDIANKQINVVAIFHVASLCLRL